MPSKVSHHLLWFWISMSHAGINNTNTYLHWEHKKSCSPLKVILHKQERLGQKPQHVISDWRSVSLTITNSYQKALEKQGWSLKPEWPIFKHRNLIRWTISGFSITLSNWRVSQGINKLDFHKYRLLYITINM